MSRMMNSKIRVRRAPPRSPKGLYEFIVRRLPARPHAAQRIADRYGVLFTAELRAKILQKIWGHEFLHEEIQSRDRRLYIVYCEGLYFRVVYSAQIREIITFLPLKPRGTRRHYEAPAESLEIREAHEESPEPSDEALEFNPCCCEPTAVNQSEVLKKIARRHVEKRNRVIPTVLERLRTEAFVLYGIPFSDEINQYIVDEVRAKKFVHEFRLSAHRSLITLDFLSRFVRFVYNDNWPGVEKFIRLNVSVEYLLKARGPGYSNFS